MYFSAGLRILVFSFLLKGASGTITLRPLNGVAELYGQAMFYTIATDFSGSWYFSANGTQSEELFIVVPPCMLRTGFEAHYRTDTTGGTNACNLIVANITMAQAGVYRYVESDSFSALLTVTETSPVITVNNTNATRTAVENQSVIIECALNHNGSVAPAPTLRPYFNWKDSDGANVNSSYDSTTENTAVSQITVTAGRQNITPHTCHVYFRLNQTSTSYATNIPTVSKSANSSTIEVLYDPKITNMTSSVPIADNCVYKPENLTCKADANPPAEYEWLDLSNNTMTTGAVKSITSGGQYQCIAYNNIMNKRHNDTKIAKETNCYPPYNLTITGPSCANNSCACAVNQTEVMLTCMAEGNPNVTYQWRSDVPGNEDLGSQAIIEAKFNGTYSCIATNTFGNQPHSETVSVIVYSCPPGQSPLLWLIFIPVWIILCWILGFLCFPKHYNVSERKDDYNERFPVLIKMLPCLNKDNNAEAASKTDGGNVGWIILYIVMVTFFGLFAIPIMFFTVQCSNPNKK